SVHGRLLRSAWWRLEDPSSKNGAIVGGKPTRQVEIAPDTWFELGHTVFWIGAMPFDDDPPLDIGAEELRSPHPLLATFVGRLAASFDALARIAPSSVPVVITGETGTGKEVVARALHELSRRPGKLVAMNCGGLPGTLLEDDLFGHRRSAFS